MIRRIPGKAVWLGMALAYASAQTPGPESAWRSGARFVRHVTAEGPDVLRQPLAAGQFVRIAVMQDGVNLVVSLRDPAGRVIFDIDSGNGRFGPETVAVITREAGEYALQVKLKDPKDKSCEYSLMVSEVRPATGADAGTVAAHADYAESARLNGLETAAANAASGEKLKTALRFFRGSDDRYMHGLTAYGLGTVMLRSSAFRDAAPMLEEAAAQFRLAGDRHGEAGALNNQAGAFDGLAEPENAIRLYRQAFSLYGVLNDRRQQAVVLNGIATEDALLANFESALEDYQEAVGLFRALGETRFLANALSNMGVTYERLGEMERAKDLLEEALSLGRSGGDPRFEPATLGALGNLYVARNQPAKAMEYLSQALAIWKTLGNRQGQVLTLVNQGLAAAQMGRLAESQRALSEALELARAVHDRRATGEALVFLAAAALRSGDAAQSLEYGEQAVAEFHTVGDRAFEARALETVARAHSALGHRKEALQRMEESLQVGEQTRLGAESEHLRASFFATRQDAYAFYIDLLMRGGAAEALALEASERARARSLLEMLSASGTKIHEGIDAKLLARQMELSSVLNAKGARLLRLMGTTAPAAAELSAEIRKLEAEYEDVQTAIRKASPQYAALTQPRVLTAAEIQRELLDGDTLLLEYSLGEERSYLWVLGQDSLHTYTLPARQTIEAQALRVAQLLAARADAALPAAARELSEMAIGKAAPELGDKRLLIVPDGGLQRVPFAMLPMPGTDEPLLERHEIVMAPSASALAALRAQVAGRKPAPKLLAVFADPVFDASDPRAGGVEAAAQPAESSRLLVHLAADDAGITTETAAGAATLRIPRLPYTAQEADEILRVAPRGSSWKAVGFAASRAAALSADLSQYRFLHFATHGYLDAERPALSALVLSQIDAQHHPVDGFLRVNDIYNSRLSADLVSLSACQTGLGREVRGEGLMGLTRAFFYAGVPRVVVSLWNVNDRATASLMAAFYEKMLRAGERPSQALREAQLELRKQKRWASPYYWAAFVQQGEWQWGTQ